MQPRDAAAASRTAAGLTVVAGAVSAGTAATAPPSGAGQQVLAWAVPTLLLAAAGFLWRTRNRPSGAVLTLLPVAGVSSVAALDVATSDASAGAQAFLFFPVTYAAAHLRAPAAIATTTAAVAADVLVSFRVQALERAFVDTLYVSTALVVITGFLITAGNHQERLVERLRRQANVDSLTGLVTRRALDELAPVLIREQARGNGSVLLVMDVDRFKSINDTYGHPVGDEVLIHLAALLSQQVRADSTISRLGGDEIAVLMPGCPLQVGLERARQIVCVVRDNPLLLPDGRHVSLSVSLGVAHSPTHADHLEGLYAAADHALYQAKRDGRGRADALHGSAGTRQAGAGWGSATG